MIRHQREQDSEFIAEKKLLWDSEGVKQHIPLTANETTQSQDQLGFLTFDPKPQFNEVKDQATPEEGNKQSELFWWHYHLGHLSFDRLLLLAKLGEIPKYLSKVKPPNVLDVFLGHDKETIADKTIPK